MKAIDRSQKALDLVDRLIKKMDGLDASPLGALVAARLGEAIGRAQHLNCPDEAAIGIREQDLDQALETWTQYRPLANYRERIRAPWLTLDAKILAVAASHLGTGERP